MQAAGRWLITTVVLLSAALLAGCSTEDGTRTSPTLAEAVEEAATVDGLESLAVWRHDELVVETYLTGDADTLRDVRSVTKSIVSLLVGSALQDGRLDSPDQPVGDLLPDVRAAYGPDKAAISLRDLLSMTGGLSWDESDLDEYLDWRSAGDPVAHYLERPVLSEPGSRFQYSSAGINVVGRALEEATGADLAVYADQVLFAPLGIDAVEWERLADGSVNAASGLDLRTIDLVLLGRLVLAEGTWAGASLVDPAWVTESTSVQIDGPDGPYGFGWWIEREPVTVAVASGYGGQTLAVAPADEVVVVVTADWNVPAGEADRQAGAVVEYLRRRLLPAILEQES